MVIVQDGEDVEYMARKLLEKYKKWNLNINLEKTEYLGIGDPSMINLEIDQNNMIKTCNTYTYLGITTNKQGESEDAVMDRISKERKITGALNLLFGTKT